MWVEAVEEFGFGLFQALVRRSDSRNIFFSPLGVARALSLLCNGARGETQKAIARVLRLQAADLQAINLANAELEKSLSGANARAVLIADSIWSTQGPPRPEFVQLGRHYYNAAVERVNPAEALQATNAWARQSSGGRIQEILTAAELPFDLALINTVLFKGSWKFPFDEAQTREHPFWLPNGTQKRYPLMFQTRKYRYFKHPRFAALEVPFEADRFCLYVLLPDMGVHLKPFLQGIDAGNWAHWMQQFATRDVFLGLPRLDVDHTATFNDALSALGMGVAFGQQADFANLLPVPPKRRLSLVKQSTFLDFDEQGAEAGSVSAITVGKSFAPGVEAIDMVIDRPFFCAIRDMQTRAILFLGSVAEP